VKLWSLFGTPLYYDELQNGYAVWAGDQLSSTYWSSLVVFDDMLKHNDHYDFISATIDIDIPSTKVSDVINLDESIMYDQLRKKLTVRCNSIMCIMGTVFAAIQIAYDEINNTDARGIIKKYKEEDVTSSEYDELSYNLSTAFDKYL